MTPSQIAEAMRDAAAAAEAYGNDGNPDIHNEPVSVATGIETASREIAAAIRAIPIPDYSEWMLMRKCDECGGKGWTAEHVQVCCDKLTSTGDCCQNYLDDQVQQNCVYCDGRGYLQPDILITAKEAPDD